MSFRSLKETGQKLFIETILKVTEETLDVEDRLAVEEKGARGAAEEQFYTLKSIDYSAENWFIGYQEGRITGLVIPQVLDDELGTINYIGVIPAERGRGYVLDLLAQGIENLFTRSVRKVVAEIDEGNFPMEKALLKAGFRAYKRILLYRMEL